MSAKKNKALERKLMEDLLEDPTDAINGVPAKPDNTHPLEAPGDHTVPVADDVAPAPAPRASDLPTDRVGVGDDATVRLPEQEEPQSAPASAPSGHGLHPDDEVRASVGRYGAFRNASSPTGAALAQSENLRIAQGRILDLEQEIERLRLENEQLGAAGETFRRKADELTSRAEDLENRYQNAVSTHSQEKSLLIENKESLRHELESAKQKNEELEIRISTNIQKIRVRERELENRLELVKMEGAALVRTKDEMILDLKRQIDQLNLELNNYRTKSQELNRAILDKQDILRRTVKALRLALTMLEGEDDAAQPQKKAK